MVLNDKNLIILQKFIIKFFSWFFSYYLNASIICCLFNSHPLIEKVLGVLLFLDNKFELFKMKGFFSILLILLILFSNFNFFGFSIIFFGLK